MLRDARVLRATSGGALSETDLWRSRSRVSRCSQLGLGGGPQPAAKYAAIDIIMWLMLTGLMSLRGEPAGPIDQGLAALARQRHVVPARLC